MENNPYIILPMDVSDRVHKALLLALEMSKRSYPHLTEDMRFAINRMEDTAGYFRGEKPETKQAYKHGK